MQPWGSLDSFSLVRPFWISNFIQLYGNLLQQQNETNTVLYSTVVMKTGSEPKLPGLNPDSDTSSVSLGKFLEVFYNLAFFPYLLKP